MNSLVKKCLVKSGAVALNVLYVGTSVYISNTMVNIAEKRYEKKRNK